MDSLYQIDKIQAKTKKICPPSSEQINYKVIKYNWLVVIIFDIWQIDHRAVYRIIVVKVEAIKQKYSDKEPIKEMSILQEIKVVKISNMIIL